ncbi:hypothetical protein EVAR_37054_1 [Eumeta japonica]|uniref:Uncharacterized protein n=1 Tax=Eumeta variegata TaxID=151549 RepID=A0A4C1WHW9_EUMVA|nr:hypothetical protein EVAR_37054_1 [Eumeta japonica]
MQRELFQCPNGACARAAPAPILIPYSSCDERRHVGGLRRLPRRVRTPGDRRFADGGDSSKVNKTRHRMLRAYGSAVEVIPFRAYSVSMWPSGVIIIQMRGRRRPRRRPPRRGVQTNSRTMNA